MQEGKKTSLTVKIFSIAAAVVLAVGVVGAVFLGTDSRTVSGKVLPEITPEPTPAPSPTEPPIEELSDEQGPAEDTLLDETGISLMKYAFAEIKRRKESGEEISTEELFPGVHDERVINMKLRLIELGYMEGDEPTDYYGEQVAYSIQLFQRKTGLEQTGLADVETLQNLYREDAPKYVVTLGMSGTDITELQKRLTELGYLKISATGYYGKDTRNAVKAFQERNGLSADGAVGEDTRELLYSEDALKAAPTATKSPTPTKTKTPTKTNSPTKTASPTKTGGTSSKPTATAEPTKEVSSENLPAPDSAKVEQFIAYAETLKGKKYVLGGKGPEVFDCSGFIYYALNNSGVKKLSYMTSAGWAKSSYPTVSKADLQRGDILCFDGHVGIYLGNQKMLDASSEEGKIRITSNIWSKNYWNTHWKFGKRVLY